MRPDAVLHLAAESHVDRSITGSRSFIETNIHGTHSIFFFQAEDGIRYDLVTGVQTCALPISRTPTRTRTSTQWTTITIGTFAAGASVMKFGYEWAFVLNSLSFLFSAACISRLRVKGDAFQPRKAALTEAEVARPWHEYVEGLRYMRANPLILGIALVGVGWATGGGAAQILFSLFGEIVFNRGPAGIRGGSGGAGKRVLFRGALAHPPGAGRGVSADKRPLPPRFSPHPGPYPRLSQHRELY